MKEVKITNHFLQRYVERVSSKRASEVRHIDAVHWCTHAILNGRELSKDSSGRVSYLYKGYVIVYKKKENIGVTVKPYTPALDDSSSYRDVKNEISSIIAKRLERQLKPIQRQKKELLIQMHENEINKLRARNPKIQKYIGIKIKKIKEEIDTLEKQILGISQVALTYNVGL